MAGNKQLPEKLRHRPLWILWSLWKARNDFVFNKRTKQPNEVMAQCMRELEEWISSQNSNDDQMILSRGTRRQLHMSSCWEPPENWYKLNFDCSFSNNSQTAGVGWILRDFKGAYVADRKNVALLFNECKENNLKVISH